jgi:hypothetical protein
MKNGLFVFLDAALRDAAFGYAGFSSMTNWTVQRGQTLTHGHFRQMRTIFGRELPGRKEGLQLGRSRSGSRRHGAARGGKLAKTFLLRLELWDMRRSGEPAEWAFVSLGHSGGQRRLSACYEVAQVEENVRIAVKPVQTVVGCRKGTYRQVQIVYHSMKE